VTSDECRGIIVRVTSDSPLDTRPQPLGLLSDFAIRYSNSGRIGLKSNIQPFKASIEMDFIVTGNQKGETMKTTGFSAMLSLSALLSACANYQAGGYVQSGVQALLAGNNQTALSYLQAAAQQDPSYIYDVQLRLGVLSYLGRAQYLTGNYAQARQTLEGALAQNTSDNLARLYLGLTQARLGDNQAALTNIEASMKQMNSWLNYLNGNFPGEGWDPGGAIQGRIKNALAMISSGNVEWPRLFADGESVGLGVAQQQQTFRQLFIDST
jgi:tetratricopeptide (TPR) repeat protein